MKNLPFFQQYVAVAILGAGLANLFAAVYGQSTGPASDLETALAALEYQTELTEGWIIEFTKSVKFRDHADDSFKEQTTRLSERRLGDKFRVEEDELGSDHPETRWFEHRTFDGERQMTLTPLNERGGMSSSDDRPSAFGTTMYVDLQPFPSVLKEWKPLRDPVWVTREGRRLLSLELSSLKNLCEYEILLDPTNSWQPAEYTRIAFAQPGGTKETSNWQESRCKFTKYHTEGEICIPTRSEYTSDNIEPKGKRFRSWETIVEVTSIQINPDLSQETFTIDYPDGTKVYDRDRQVTFTAGEPGSEQRVRATVPTERLGGSPNPAAGPWWSDYRLWIALTVVFISGALWWRWREQH